ncbi:MAG: DMT family transporter [Spirochaetales bacterium]|nr:MAG: DMT family transporter [Spirochaetales bacterium]
MAKRTLWQFLLLFSMFAFATTYPISKVAVTHASPFAVAAIRYLSANLILLPFYLIERKKLKAPVRVRDFILMNVWGLLGVAVFALLLLFGVRLSNSSNGSLLINTQPIFAVFFAPLLRKERFSWLKLISAAVGIGGMYFVVTGGQAQGVSFFREMLLGNCILLGASVSMTLYTLFLTSYVVRYGGIISTFMCMLASSLVIAVLAVTQGNGLREFSLISSRDFLLVLYSGILGTALPYVLFNKAMAVLSFTTATAFKVLIPVFGVLLSLLFLGETHSWLSYLGMGIVFLSLGFIVFIKKEPSLRQKA